MTEKLRPVVAAIVLLVLATIWLRACHDPEVSRRALQGQQDTRDDSTHVSNDAWKAQFLARDTARDDTLRHLAVKLQNARGEIARLTAKIPPAVTASDTARDKVIAAQAAHIVQQDSSFAAERRLFRTMLADRDSLIIKREREITALTTARDTWKRAARGSKLGCAGGPGVVASIDGHVSAGVGIVCGIRL